MDFAYHGSYRDNHDSIMREGILARDTTEWNYSYVSGNAGVKAVYVWNSYVRDATWQYLDFNVYKVDVRGLPLELDPVLAREDDYRGRVAYRVLADIPPDRIVEVLTPEVD